MTVAEALNVQERPLSSREAEIFLQYSLGRDRAWLIAHPDYELSPEETAAFQAMENRRATNEPVAYIVGEKEFYGRPFKCDKRALIPRPETEGVIDYATAWLHNRFQEKSKASNKPCPQKILELGTGSGNIAVTLALELAAKTVPADILATDVSAEALALAQANAEALVVATEAPTSRVNLIEANLFDHADIAAKAPYDAILANLPYVPTTWQYDPAAQPDVIFHEPDVALFSGQDGLDIYRAFFGQVLAFLKPDGKIIIEYGDNETSGILELVKKHLPEKTVTVHQDYAGLDRILEIA